MFCSCVCLLSVCLVRVAAVSGTSPVQALLNPSTTSRQVLNISPRTEAPQPFWATCLGVERCHNEKVLPYVQVEFPMFWFEPIATCSVLEHHLWRAWLFIPSHLVFKHMVSSPEWYLTPAQVSPPLLIAVSLLFKTPMPSTVLHKILRCSKEECS